MMPSIRSLLGALVISFAFVCEALPAATNSLAGIVLDEDGQALPAATVRLQGTTATATTGRDGRFRIDQADAPRSKHITAWKQGYFIGGEPLRHEPAGEYRITLKRLPVGDNAQYRWTPPRPGDGVPPGAKACATCHVGDGLRLMDEWERSAHAKSATNPTFLEFFAGSDEGGALIPQLGYKLDFPHSNGSCATCHVPAMALHKPFDSDPRQAGGVERDGVFCDFCHKIEDVATDHGGGRPGVLAIKLKRPEAGQQVFFGPYDDVHPGPDTFNPLYRQSRYCAACHDGKFWNISVYSEFQEWSASSYPKRDIQCQDCHMRPDGATRRFALEKEGSLLRDPATVASHALLGSRDAAFMREAVVLTAKAHVDGDHLKVAVTIKNAKAGHHVPTGSPMRNMVLRVDAVDGDGRRLALAEGGTVPAWAGKGAESEGNYAGLPGKGYAKVLKRWPDYRGDNRALVLSPLYPSPFWRPVVLDYDNRIAADSTDASSYAFELPASAAKPVRVSAKLIYRRTFKSWLKPGTGAGDDLVLANENVSVDIGRSGDEQAR